ncbi:MAG: hypothetical protein RMJ43_06825 [Chloroherpetonaceae bacterium]|nr:hypothetical protein [Chthonomonadaceae bacterium]MDW8207534.1 hypothetical protein [Chloroherpetonaceae bacterium]
MQGQNRAQGVDAEAVIEEILGEHPRARELRQMRSVLEQRKDAMTRERDRCRNAQEREALEKKLAELEQQIAILRQEEEITAFVEASVRVSLLKEPD